MNGRQPRSDDRFRKAASPTIGSALLIAIMIISTSVFGFVYIEQSGESEISSTAAVSVSQTGVTENGYAASVKLERLYSSSYIEVKSTSGTVYGNDVNGNGRSAETATVGDTIDVRGASEGATITVIAHAENEDQAVLKRYTIQS